MHCESHMRLRLMKLSSTRPWNCSTALGSLFGMDFHQFPFNSPQRHPVFGPKGAILVSKSWWSQRKRTQKGDDQGGRRSPETLVLRSFSRPAKSTKKISEVMTVLSEACFSTLSLPIASKALKNEHRCYRSTPQYFYNIACSIYIFSRTV